MNSLIRSLSFAALMGVFACGVVTPAQANDNGAFTTHMVKTVRIDPETNLPFAATKIVKPVEVAKLSYNSAIEKNLVSILSLGASCDDHLEWFGQMTDWAEGELIREFGWTRDQSITAQVSGLVLMPTHDHRNTAVNCTAVMKAFVDKIDSLK